MDASDVFNQYLELFSNDTRQLQLLIAPNGVVDWFGRAVRGVSKIHDFLRYDVNVQYKHNSFEKAVACSPIEHRAVHIKTKSLPSDSVDYVRPKNKVTEPTSLKTYADSDLDDDDLELQPLPAAPNDRTPERLGDVVCAAELTPPSSTIKAKPSSSDSDTDDSDDDDYGATSAKRLKRSHPTPFSYLKRLPVTGTTTKVSKRKASGDYDMHMLGDDTSSGEEDDDTNTMCDASSAYTQLHYLEATGVLQVKNPLQSSAATTPPHRNEFNSLESSVRIRLSYRQRISDKQLQFVLIIYEHLERPARMHARRRNLMAQFNTEAESATTSNETNIEEENAEFEGEELPVMLSHEEEVQFAATPDVSTETPAFSVPALRTPTRSIHTPPATPKRKPRLPYTMSGVKRLSPSVSTPTPKRSAARSLRL